MGAITEDKQIYDRYAVDYFNQRGWKAFAIAKPGRYADVLAAKGNNLAIVEVKSPKETSAVKAYDDSANLSDFLRQAIGDYLKETRFKIFDLFPEVGQSIQKLYAVTIASQIYRYLYELEERAVDYERAVNGAIELTGKNYNKVPYLIVPSEYGGYAKEAVERLKKRNYISRVSIDLAPNIFVLAFGFN